MWRCVLKNNIINYIIFKLYLWVVAAILREGLLSQNHSHKVGGQLRLANDTFARAKNNVCEA